MQLVQVPFTQYESLPIYWLTSKSPEYFLANIFSLSFVHIFLQFLF